MKQEDKTSDITISEKVSEKSRKHFKYRSNECPNCGQPLDLSDRYCPYCSQLNSTKSLTLRDFIQEFFSSIISYDSRLRYTITDLLFKPGVISKNYIKGKRLRYTNPFRFFLSVSIIYFLLYNVVNFFNPDYDVPLFNINSGENSSDENIENKKENIDSETFLIAQDTIRYATEKDTPPQEINIQDTVSKKEKTQKTSFWIMNGDTIYDKNKSYSERILKLDSMDNASRLAMKFQIFRDFYSDTEIKDPNKALDSLKLEKTRLNQWLYKKNRSLDSIGESPRDFVNYLLSKVPFFVFFFAPFFALFFWLLYVRHSYTYMEHLVFIFHIFSFVFLALIVGSIPDLIFNIDFFANLLFAVVGPIYFYLALRKFYGQSHIKTAIKFILLNIFFFVSSLVAAILFFAVTAALY